MGGLNLNAALDAIPAGQFSRLTNCLWSVDEPRALTGRPGAPAFLTTTAGDLHSIARMTDLQPDPAENVYLLGVDGALYLGYTGAATEIDTGYSGDPLTLLPNRPPLSGDPWIYVADRARMRKVRFDGLDLEIGLPAPTLAVTTALDVEQRTTIATIDQDAPDGTQPAAWTPNPGRQYNEEGEDVGPTNPPVVSGPGASIKNAFILQPDPFEGFAGINLGGCWSFFGLPLTVNLNQVGAVPASDDDIIHVEIGYVLPAFVAEVRLYFVCSPTFTPSVLPGGDQTGLVNSDYYMKAFRPDDFATQVQGIQSQIDASESARVAQARNQSLETEAEQGRYTWVTAQERDAQTPQGRITRVNDSFMASTDPRRSRAKLASGSVGAITEFGTIGIPLRRGDFKRYGSTAGQDWGTITGLVIFLQSTPGPPILCGAIVTDLYLTGGSGPDTIDPGAQSYDYRYTHYDPRTGTEGNPSPIQETPSYLDSLRRAIVVSPVAYGDAAVRQRIYRRGGTNYDDWHYCGVNDGDGAAFTDVETDLGIAAAGTVEIDHYQPVATIDDTGATVLAQPIPVLFGPYNGMLLGLGDPYRPGFVYASLPGEPDHWPPDLTTEVCPPSEQLMAGVMYGGQPYVFSREALYAIYGNLTGGNGLTSAPTGCKHGLASRWAWAVGGGAIWFVSRDNIYRTAGGPEDPVGNALAPLFQGATVNGYLPINLFAEGATALRLVVYADELWFGYEDTDGNRQIMVMQIQTGAWRHYQYPFQPSALYNDVGNPSGASILFGGRDTGTAYYQDLSLTSDDGAEIAGLWRTGSWDWGHPREEKLFMDQILDVNPQGVDLTLQNFVNTETVTNPAQGLPGFSGRRRTIWDSFGSVPQRARTLATEVRWSTASAPPIFYVFGSSITMQPDLTINRVTNWDDLGHPDQAYLMGVTFDCDTGGEDREIIVERDWDGVISTVATLTVNCDGRHKVKFSWPALPANQVRIRPNDDCLAWILYRADWIWQPEPPRIARWDIHFENAWDQYLTGLDLYCDTEGATKRIVVEMDGVSLTNPATGDAWWDIVANGRQVVHLTMQTVPPLRGHVLRFYATDDNPGLLYSHRWHTEAEPSEQHNWNQPFTILGTQADKWVKAVIFEMDSFGLDKTVRIEADGVAVDTVTVNTNGRLVRQVAIPQQLGRVWRFIPTDNNPSRLYTIRLAFDEEPFQLDRWETQELPFGNLDFKSILQHQVTLKSTAEVTLTLALQTSQVEGTPFTTVVLTLPSTAGIKRTVFVPPPAYKWILAKFLLTSEQPFWLYQEETRVTIQPWEGGSPYLVHPFGNSDNDPTRSMLNSSLAAARDGGGTA